MDVYDILTYLYNLRTQIESIKRDQAQDHDNTYKKLKSFAFPVKTDGLRYLVWDCVNKPCTKEEYNTIYNGFKDRSDHRDKLLMNLYNNNFDDTGLVSTEDYETLDMLDAIYLIEKFLTKFI
jgi:hypothetical protein